MFRTSCGPQNYGRRVLKHPVDKDVIEIRHKATVLVDSIGLPICEQECERQNGHHADLHAKGYAPPGLIDFRQRLLLFRVQDLPGWLQRSTGHGLIWVSKTVA